MRREGRERVLLRALQVEEQFGDPAEYLCKPCYETVPASVWDAAKERLRRSHQYDHL
jgi:hypothetical protein